jgi:hypothetical protein
MQQPQGNALTKIQTYSLVFLLMILSSCSNPHKGKCFSGISLSYLLPALNRLVINDSLKIDLAKNITPTNANRFSKPIYIRGYEIGASDAKFNGEAVVIEMDIPSAMLKAHPDTLKKEVRQNYANSERFFPRSIADDFVNGISTEHISYPQLNYAVKVYENEFAAKPYTTQTFRAWKDKAGQLVVE